MHSRASAGIRDSSELFPGTMRAPFAPTRLGMASLRRSSRVPAFAEMDRGTQRSARAGWVEHRERSRPSRVPAPAWRTGCRGVVTASATPRAARATRRPARMMALLFRQKAQGVEIRNMMQRSFYDFLVSVSPSPRPLWTPSSERVTRRAHERLHSGGERAFRAGPF